MGIIIITGSSGLIGSESVKFFCDKGHEIVGIDNDMRKYFFGEGASTRWVAKTLTEHYPNFSLEEVDIRDYESINTIFAKYNKFCIMQEIICMFSSYYS